MNNELLIVISGPSGAGKGTVVGKLINEGDYALSISATTRNPRPGEENGVSYFFKTKEEFEKLIEDNMLLEYASFCDNYYGTPAEYVNNKINEGKNVILEIEVQGALQVKKNRPDTVMIFMIPPTLAELEKRLTERGTETPDVIKQRLKRAEEEIELAKEYDYIVVNDTVENTVNRIKTIVEAEKLKINRNKNLVNDFKGVK
ncbi:MAG: guanylate kinase [Lachnospirales bacterium]